MQDQPNEHHPSDDGRADHVGRRAFLVAGLVTALAGCTTSTKTAHSIPDYDLKRDEHSAGSDPVIARPTSPEPRPNPSAQPRHAGPAAVTVDHTRTAWAAGPAVPRLMNPMRPVRYITIHHDGIDPFYATDAASARGRLERIRRAHRGRQWGDIGYHFAVDRSGRIWECRPLDYQGAHVKHHNEGNVGILVMGNFQQQRPSEAQIRGVQRCVQSVTRAYRLDAGRVRTHREWAATLCPGNHLQLRVDALRSSHALA